MEISIVHHNARSVVVKINDGGKYYTLKAYDIYLNNKFIMQTNKCITSIYKVVPNTNYEIEIRANNEIIRTLSFKSDNEFVTLNVKDFKALGDGVSDDTIFIQAAIMACPKNARVYLPKGNYLVSTLFLKSDLKLELAKDAKIIAKTTRDAFPILPGIIKSYDEKSEYNLGTWEGNPLDMYSSIICGINIENVELYGEGTIDGMASNDNWWHDFKVMKGAFRPRLFFINHCNNVCLWGLTFTNSPSWTLHPYFSNNLKFIDLSIINPFDSPNTDGLDPESCSNIEITGVNFSLGDDCIALKSGKIYMGSTYKTPCSNINISHSLMANGHGAITIGSEMAGGVNNVLVSDCVFLKTDRGLRIKTRRGRGNDALIDEVNFKNIEMDKVLTPFVINEFYYCDPDGKSDYVQSIKYCPFDYRTPIIKALHFENIHATNASVAVAYFYGLPEKKISLISMKNIFISFNDKCEPSIPAMMCGIKPVSKMGLYANNIERLILENVVIENYEHEAFIINNVDEVIKSEDPLCK